MVRKLALLVLVLMIAMPVFNMVKAQDQKYHEAPMLADMVKAGTLPSVDKRLPEDPLVVQPVEEVGQYGGTWRLVDSDDNLYWLWMTIYVEPFVKWNRDANGFRPNLLSAWEWNDAKTELVAHFRKGMKWSDGEPLTVDDYLFWWNDMVMDETVHLDTPAGTRVNGEPMKVAKVDDYTLKFTFVAPNPLFLEYHSRGAYHSSQFIVPAHYLKQFHPKYNKDVKDTKELMNRYNWGVRLHYPDMPTMTAWKVTKFTSGQLVTLERNPYYWKVDTKGNQLPYIDHLESQIAGTNASKTVVLKAIAGELDMQVREIPLLDLPLVQDKAKDGDYRVILWNRGDYAWPWLILMYDYEDPGIVDLMYNQSFRQALSYSINRDRINDVVTLGLAKPRQFSLSEESPEFQTPEGQKFYKEWASSYAQFEPDKAAKLLDSIKVVDTNGDGLRERPDGKKLELIVDVDASDDQSVKAMQLIKQDWEKVGLSTVINATEGSVMDDRSNAGKTMIRAWGSAAAWGLISAPTVWTPIEGVTYSVGGPRIGLYYQTGGKQGVAPRPGSMLEKLQKAYTELISITDPAKRDAKLLEAYRIHIDEGPISIGTVGELPSPVVVKNNFRNVPDKGLVAGWDLGYPGTADPEQFFFKK